MPDPLRPHGLEIATTDRLAPADLAACRALMDLAWSDPDDRFSDDDWAHALGGIHVLVRDGGDVVSHGSVVPRRIAVDGAWLDAGHVEAVATRPDRQRQGFGSAVMRALGDAIRDRHALGVLSTGEGGFYARLGWTPWHGPTWVRRAGGMERTPHDDGGIWVLRTPRSPAFTGAEPIACEERPGDDW